MRAAGPDGNYKTNLWTWSWAMNANSRNKLPAWLFMQWATGKESLNKAVEGGTYADPVRKSVFDTTFKRVAAASSAIWKRSRPSSGSSKIQFTPQKKFFDTTRTGRSHCRTSTAGRMPRHVCKPRQDQHLQGQPLGVRRHDNANIQGDSVHANRRPRPRDTRCPEVPIWRRKLRPYLLSIPALVIVIGILYPFVLGALRLPELRRR